jgi:hypothetical protein
MKIKKNTSLRDYHNICSSISSDRYRDDCQESVISTTTNTIHMITTTTSSPSNSSKNVINNKYLLTQIKFLTVLLICIARCNYRRFLFCMLVCLTNKQSQFNVVVVVVLNKDMSRNIFRIFHVLKSLI